MWRGGAGISSKGFCWGRDGGHVYLVDTELIDGLNYLNRGQTMASLRVETTRSAGVLNLTILVDTNPVTLDTDGKGTANISGSCGDLSRHDLTYTFRGAVGEKIGVNIFCGSQNVCEVKEAKVWPSNVPYASGGKGFTI
jgi:hypothetical protein